MTKLIYARSVSDALGWGLLHLNGGEAEETVSRNGPVRAMPGPVVIETQLPQRRVLFSPKRNANPYFHFMESLWMLSGRSDLPWLCQFNKRMAEYSDDNGATQPGAYGHRWRQHFQYDQLTELVDLIAENPNTRRACLGMWDPWGVHTMFQDGDPTGEYQLRGDLFGASSSKDVPCNTHVYFQLRVTGYGYALDMTVCCRSNDALWGAHGANAVHFSVLQEYMAARIGAAMDDFVSVGTMIQFSNNYHVYPEALKCPMAELAEDAHKHDHYTVPYRDVFGEATVQPTQLFTAENVALFDEELPKFMDFADLAKNPYVTPWRNYNELRRETKWVEFRHPTLRDVAMPMLASWDMHKAGSTYDAAFARACAIGGGEGDWSLACRQWMERRKARFGGED
jgi:thymidylate synthase